MTDMSGRFLPGPRRGADRRMGRRTVTRGAAWAVPVIAVAAAAPAFAASPNVAVAVAACEPATGQAFTGCPSSLTSTARVTWTIDTNYTIPQGATFRLIASRSTYCTVNRYTGTLHSLGYVGDRADGGSSTNCAGSGSCTANITVVKAIPPGIYTFSDRFAVSSGASTTVTLCAPEFPAETTTSDNCAGKVLSVSGGATSC